MKFWQFKENNSDVYIAYIVLLCLAFGLGVYLGIDRGIQKGLAINQEEVDALRQDRRDAVTRWKYFGWCWDKPEPPLERHKEKI